MQVDDSDYTKQAVIDRLEHAKEQYENAGNVDGIAAAQQAIHDASLATTDSEARQVELQFNRGDDNSISGDTDNSDIGSDPTGTADSEFGAPGTADQGGDANQGFGSQGGGDQGGGDTNNSDIGSGPTGTADSGFGDEAGGDQGEGDHGVDDHAGDDHAGDDHGGDDHGGDDHGGGDHGGDDHGGGDHGGGDR